MQGKRVGTDARDAGLCGAARRAPGQVASEPVSGVSVRRSTARSKKRWVG